ncbi:hypothetical protein DM02DRAFT_272089 [Periconia macrospinosa]|uniref:Uncharacterized protein n=1 Tax=Periconia macrospinosa TaxID=97972 RepID=A0A2V1D3E1_9PLEO|nr:hypothetical protein DM02DRAFT_272089 [Periconia macrospinosa]
MIAIALILHSIAFSPSYEVFFFPLGHGHVFSGHYYVFGVAYESHLLPPTTFFLCCYLASDTMIFSLSLSLSFFVSLLGQLNSIHLATALWRFFFFFSFIGGRPFYLGIFLILNVCIVIAIFFHGKI